MERHVLLFVSVFSHNIVMQNGSTTMSCVLKLMLYMLSHTYGLLASSVTFFLLQ